ncbi:aspartate kinase, monofunctional class [Aggregatilinea lenta]|uniref:aspartate kinase, monofunctional class n=1 Tax=Aggregatilinea lenta TaxID=913108 RepID=UPI000E5A83EE|nr:aspartate kinase, monofunctional class [Aggregatilinea lenta]
MARITMKFGGTSVGSPEAIAQVADIVKHTVDERHEVLVVCSAMSGVTNLLTEGALTAAAGNPTRYQAIATHLREKHSNAIRQLLPSDVERISIRDEVDSLIDEFETLCYGIYVLREASHRVMDKVTSLGERMAMPIISAALRHNGVSSTTISASYLIVTDDQFQNAGVLFDDTERRIRRELVPVLAQRIVPVVTGFLGATRDGVITTLGRGGSDYSAAILGAYVDSDEVWIWTDVDGVMTTDPRVAPDAQVLPVLSYGEVAEMAYFGAKVLHPKTVQPLVDRNIPIRVKNTFNPSFDGTLLTHEEHVTPSTVKAVTAIRDVSMITVAGRGMVGVPGIAARTFAAVAKQNANVLMISQSSSEQSICFIVPEEKSASVVESVQDELAHEYGRQDIQRTWADDDVEIVTVVGAGMRATPGVAARVFGALKEASVNVLAIAHGASDYSLSIVVRAADTERAVQSIHRLVVLNGISPNVHAPEPIKNAVS